MKEHTDFASVASLLADASRAAMVAALMNGKFMPAGDLARAAGVRPQTASSHLSHLVTGGLLAVHRSGRHRYYGIASEEVAQVLEGLSSISPRPRAKSLTQAIQLPKMALARCCYNHLAGRIAVAIADSLVRQRRLSRVESVFLVTEAGAQFFESLGIAVPTARKTRVGFASSCIDWTERRRHISGRLGSALLEQFLARGVLRASTQRRVLDITERGKETLRRLFGVDGMLFDD